MHRHVAAALLATLMLVSGSDLLARQVRVAEGPSTPYAHSGEVAKPRGPDPTTFARFFVSAAAGTPG